MRSMRRHRLAPVAIAFALAAVFGVLAVFVSESLFLLLPVVLACWFILYMPWWRRKVRRQARALPKWDLHPE